MNGLPLAAALYCLWLPCSAHAWGDEGHEIVALIADHYLTTDVRARLNLLLGDDKSGLTGDRGIAAESTWADRYRQYHRETGDWHYIDIESQNPDIPSAHGRLVAKIDQFRMELADPSASPQEHLVALQFLLHLIGDLHQPLFLLAQRFGDLLIARSDLFLTGSHARFQLVQMLFLDRKRVELAVERVLALFQPGLVALQLGSGGLDFPVDVRLALQLLLPRGQFQFLGFILGFT